MIPFYDIIHIQQKIEFNESFYPLISSVIGEDQENYKSHNSAYYEQPLIEIKRALQYLREDAEWMKHWDNFNESLVFDDQKISYAEAISLFSERSDLICHHLESALHN